MPDGQLGLLAEAQRETVKVLALLTERLHQRFDPDDSGEERRSVLPGRLPAGELPLPRIEGALSDATRAISDLSQATTSNTQALGSLARDLGGLPGLLASLAAPARSGGGGLGTVLSSGLGFVPLGLKIAGLFRGGRTGEPAAPSSYAPPPSLALEVANSEPFTTGFSRVERGETARPRAVEPERSVVFQPTVTVNVSAIDSRSFLDHSDQIARAVREAMLHMHPVNDFISEL